MTEYICPKEIIKDFEKLVVDISLSFIQKRHPDAIFSPNRIIKEKKSKSHIINNHIYNYKGDYDDDEYNLYDIPENKTMSMLLSWKAQENKEFNIKDINIYAHIIQSGTQMLMINSQHEEFLIQILNKLNESKAKYEKNVLSDIITTPPINPIKKNRL